MSSPDTTEAAKQHVRAIWLLGLLAKKMQRQPDGTAVLALPTRYVVALDAYGPNGNTPKAEPVSLYLALCGSPHCVQDVWETEVYGQPCPICGNTDGNAYDPIFGDADDFLDAEQRIFGGVIDTYSRADALADGGLVDVTRMAAEAGFRLPTAFTRAAWVRTVEWSDDEAALQDEDGRLWDVLSLAWRAARRAGGSSRVVFSVALIPRGRRTAEMVTLALTCGPGDDRQPVVTIMLPEED